MLTLVDVFSDVSDAVWYVPLLPSRLWTKCCWVHGVRWTHIDEQLAL